MDCRRHARAGRARCRRFCNSAHHIASCWLEAVAAELERQLDTLPTAAVARPSIENNGAIVVVDALARAVKFSNAMAPRAPRPARRVAAPGIDPECREPSFSVPPAREAAGDYASGPNPRPCRHPARPRVCAAEPLLRQELREGDLGARSSELAGPVRLTHADPRLASARGRPRNARPLRGGPP